MSQLNVDLITNRDDNGAPLLVYGANVSSGYALTCSGGISVSGVITATSFEGDGSSLTQLPVISASQAYGLQTIIKYDAHRA